jgi:hypothetical protein
VKTDRLFAPTLKGVEIFVIIKMFFMNIKGLNKAEVLVELFNKAKPLGLLAFRPYTMTLEEAKAFLSVTSYFDYLKGRVLMISLHKEEVDTRLYNRNNGKNAAENAIAQLVTSCKLPVTSDEQPVTSNQ